MRRFPPPSAAEGSSAAETMLLLALAFVLVAGLVGVVLMTTLEPRSSAENPDPAVSIGSPAVSVPVLEIACGAGDDSIDGGAVDATSEGVPVRIAGQDGALLSFVAPGIPGYRMRVFEPSGSYSLPLAPGRWTVGCAGSGVADETVTVGAFEVRDRDGVYLRTRPDCPTSGCCNEIVELPAGFLDDDLGTLHEGLAEVGVLPTDTIERAAYPESTFSARPPNPLVYRVVRDLQIVARLDLAGDGDTWSANVYGCPGG